MKQHIQENLEGNIYLEINEPFDMIRMKIEQKYEIIRTKLNEFFTSDAKMNFRNTCRNLNFEPYIIAKIYGLIKIHKEGFPIRPIISAPNLIGKEVSHWILQKLELIATCFNEVKVNDAFELFTMIADKQIENGHRLSTWDYTSMFTNIDFQFVKTITTDHYYLVEIETSVPCELFIEILSFLVEDCAIFTYKSKIFKQNKGLTMGNRLSQSLANIATNYTIMTNKSKFQKNEISFLVKFVDDIASAMDTKIISKFEEILNSTISGLYVKREDEDENRSISYLNCEINRREDNTIGVKWIQKKYSSRQIMNFHSNQPYYMKLNVVKEYIKNAIKITTDDHLPETITRLTKALNRSSYPNNFYEKFIVESLWNTGKLQTTSEIDNPDEKLNCEMELLSTCLKEGTIDNNSQIQSLVKHNKKKGQNPTRKPKFIPMPFNNNLFKRSRKAIGKFKVDVKLAPRSIMPNRNLVYSNLKDKRKLGDIRYGLFLVKCSSCPFQRAFMTANLDVERTLNHHFHCKNSPIIEHLQMNESHVIPKRVFDLKVFQNNYDLKTAYDLKCNKQSQ